MGHHVCFIHLNTPVALLHHCTAVMYCWSLTPICFSLVMKTDALHLNLFTQPTSDSFHKFNVTVLGVALSCPSSTTDLSSIKEQDWAITWLTVLRSLLEKKGINLSNGHLKGCGPTLVWRNQWMLACSLFWATASHWLMTNNVLTWLRLMTRWRSRSQPQEYSFLANVSLS